MLSYLRVKNFKSFSDITLDLRGAKKIPKSTVFIYGENGSGKSNLMLATLFLTESIRTLRLSKNKPLLEFKEAFSKVIEAFDVNGSGKYFEQDFEIRASLKEYLSAYKMIGSNDSMELEYGFRLNGYDGSYITKFDDGRIVYEELRYKIDKREGSIFAILGNGQTVLSPTVFKDNKYKSELMENIERYWGNHTFLSILYDETKGNNYSYVSARVGYQLMSILTWFEAISVWHRGHARQRTSASAPSGFLKKLVGGTLQQEDDPELGAYESLLNAFFTQLYSDVKKVYYLVKPYNDRYQYDLYFERLIDGKVVHIPFSIESNGTRQLMDVLPGIIAAMMGATVFIDEIDNGIHDLLMKKVIEIAAESCKGQLVVTTHNTLLLESCDAKNVYSINIDANGNKVVKSIAETGGRTQRTHNKRDKYLRGDYGGVPITGDFDFGELLEEAMIQTKENGSADMMAGEM